MKYYIHCFLAIAFYFTSINNSSAQVIDFDKIESTNDPVNVEMDIDQLFLSLSHSQPLSKIYNYELDCTGGKMTIESTIRPLKGKLTMTIVGKDGRVISSNKMEGAAKSELEFEAGKYRVIFEAEELEGSLELMIYKSSE